MSFVVTSGTLGKLKMRMMYSRTSMARTSLRPCKFVRDMGSLSH